MDQNFEYIIIDEKVTITKYIGTATEVEVPGFIMDLAVVRIGDYAFSECRDILIVILPDSVSEIGNHAFYNCRKLETLHATDYIHTMEDGAFKNCEALRYITLKVLASKTTCMKNLLSETNEEMHFTLHYLNEGNHNTCAKLIFPRYLHDYVENTEARVINQVTYGAGVHYRECMSESDVDYKRLDDLFRYVMANDTKETACEIAINRLQFPYKLNIEARQKYYNFLMEQLPLVVDKYLKAEDINAIEELGKLDLFTEDNIDAMIELAHSKNRIEAIRLLMQYKQSKFGVKEKSFEL